MVSLSLMTLFEIIIKGKSHYAITTTCYGLSKLPKTTFHNPTTRTSYHTCTKGEKGEHYVL